MENVWEMKGKIVQHSHSALDEKKNPHYIVCTEKNETICIAEENTICIVKYRRALVYVVCNLHRIQYDTIQYNIIQYDTIRYDTVTVLLIFVIICMLCK